MDIAVLYIYLRLSTTLGSLIVQLSVSIGLGNAFYVVLSIARFYVLINYFNERDRHCVR